MAHDSIHKKIVIMGDSAVGKTTLASKYLGHGFTEDYIPTLGANFATRVYEKNGEEIRVMIIDMAGQSSFSLLREKYFIGASGIFLVFDVTRPFDAENQIKPWVLEVLGYTNNMGLPLAVLGNKVDLHLLRQVQPYQGINAAASVKSLMLDNVEVSYFETSAKDGTGVNEAFEWLIETITEYEQDERNQSNS